MAITKEFLFPIIQEQNQLLKQKLRKYAHREIEQNLTSSIQKTDFIHVIQGPRRSGKSTLLAYLKQHVFKSNYYLNFDDERLVDFTIKDFNTLLEAFLELYGPNKYIYLDEIQNIKGWERFVSRLKNAGYKVIITGSNSQLLSQEFGTHLTGRYIPYTLFPFSFREFLSYKDADFYSQIQKQKISALTTEQSAILSKYFKQYMKYGGIPEYVKTKHPDFIKTLYENILYKDIISRYNIRSDLQLRQLATLAASNIGKIISFKSFKTIGISSTTTISQYFDYLMQTYLYFLVPKFSYSLRESIKSNKKLYILDPALAKLVGVRFSQDQGRFLENIVFLDLKRRYKYSDQIYYYKNGFECDFVIVNQGQVKELIQVTAFLTNENQEHEINGITKTIQKLNLNANNIKTTIITLEQTDKIQLEFSNNHCKNAKANIKNCKLTIDVVPIAKWLVSQTIS